MTTPLMDATEVATLLRKSARWVEREASRGVIPSIKVGRDRRFTERHIAEYIDRLTAEATPKGKPPVNQWGRKTRT